jgi:hypothetical protein
VPGPRYPDWFHLRVPNGQHAAAQRYVPHARKLLGYLAEQRALGKAPTQAIERTLPDGTYLRASFEYEIPIVEIRPALPPGGEEEPPVVEGFVVRPSPTTDQYSNPALNQVVVSPPRGKTQPKWLARFYDNDAVPDGYDLPSGRYGVSRGRELFPDGLVDSGNLDWRNKDETVIVQFHGPEARYFATGTDGNNFDTRVYYKGKPLLNTADFDPEDVPYVVGLVIGACIVKVEDKGPCLLAMVRYPPGFGNGSHRREQLLRFEVRGTAAAIERARSGAKWEELPELEVVGVDPNTGLVAVEVLADRELDDDLFGQHPWCFNQSGTEARCIRYYDDGNRIVECVLDVDKLTFTETTLSPLNATMRRSTITQLTAQPKPIKTHVRQRSRWIFNKHDNPPPATPSYLPAGVEADPDSPAETSYSRLTSNFVGDTVVAFAETVTWVPDSGQEWFICAVDYRDDVPVYAKWRIPSRSINISLTRDLHADPAEDAAYTDYGVPTEVGGFWQADYTTTITVNRSSTLTYSKQDAWTGEAILTDWVLHEAAPTVSTHSLTETGSETSEMVSIDTAQLGWVDFDGFSYPDVIHAVAIGVVASTKVASGTTSHAIAWDSLTNLRQLEVLFLDLRYRLLAVDEQRTDTRRTIFTSKTTPIGTYDEWLWVGASTVQGSTLTPAVPLVDVDFDNYTVASAARVELKVNVGHPLDKTVARTIIETGTDPVALDKWGAPRGLFSCFSFHNPEDGNGVTPLLAYMPGTDPGITDNATYDVGSPSPVVDSVPADAGIPSVIPRVQGDFGSPMNGTSNADYRLVNNRFRSTSWQAYRRWFCYSLALPWWDNAQRTYANGIGVLATGRQYDPAEDEPTLPVITGATVSEVRFHPVWVLAPTLPR